MKLSQETIKHFAGAKCAPWYYKDGREIPQLTVISRNYRNGKFTKIDDNIIHVEYGWSDSQVELERDENGVFQFCSTIGST